MNARVGRADRVSPYKLASVLLQYPTQSLFSGLDQLDTAAATTSPRECRVGFARFLAWLRATPPNEVAEHYVETFDLRRRCALYLTYHRFGDTRKRGMALLSFRTAYRVAAFEQSDGELPDYLPLVLEFASLSPKGVELLRARRADLELVRKALQQEGTPYVAVLDAVCTQLPRLRRRDLGLIRAHAENGPPHEDVGLEPFAPPEYLTGGGATR
ncbi:MAG: nitrate reductase molybdenum cofactor assembly chaperone [Marmoricola sp.]